MTRACARSPSSCSTVFVVSTGTRQEAGANEHGGRAHFKNSKLPWIHTHNSAAPSVSVLWRSACPTVSRKRSGARGTSIVDSSSISFFFAAGDWWQGRRDQFRRDWPPGMSVLIETSLGDMVFDLHTDLCPKVRPTALGVAVPSAPSAAPLRVS